MTRFQKLSLGSTAATVLLVAVGGLVRATRSGLGCGTDWPHCRGRLVPSMESRAVVIEYSHRVTATIVVILLAGLALVAFLDHRRSPGILWPSLAAFGVVIVQAILGAVVVKMELQAVSVVLHLFTAMLLLGLLVYITAAAFAATGRLSASDAGISDEAGFAASAVLLLLLVGSYVSGRGAGHVFNDWPLMNGRLIPDLSFQLAALQFLHRLLALVVGVVVAVVAVRVFRRKRELPLQTKLMHAAVGLFGLEILIGALNVWTDLNAAAVTAHLLTGALIWGCLVAVAVVSHPALRHLAQRPLTAPVRPALEGN
ncbi:MAG: COX15/CtaA family protein [Actinomycetota bacterium]|nr:COX15/CtaA family protein [Actinomycetota bacterium]